MTRTPSTVRIALVAATLLLAILPVPALGQKPVARGVAVSANVGVKVWVPAGSIRIIGWERDSLHVEGTIGTDDTFFFGGAGTGAKFGVDEPLPGRVLQPAHLTAYVPRTGRVSVRTVTASIEATDIAGWFNTVSGDVQVSGAAAEVEAEAIDGSIRLNVTGPYVRARTGSGMLAVGGRIEDLVASTISGPLTVTSAGLASGRFESVTGAIIVTAAVDRAASIDVDNHNGSVELRLPPKVAADIALTSVAGSITNLFDKRVPVAGRQGRGQELAFVTDPKGARIVVRTFKGPITLRRP